MANKELNPANTARAKSNSLASFQDTHGPEMKILPPGKFVMGTGTGDNIKLFTALGIDTSRDLGLDEEPAHLVKIDYTFAMARYCVTFDQYDAYARACGAPRPVDDGLGGDKMPVGNVTWHDAKGYVQWLAAITGKPYRLPSEAEWEYAARAGTTTDYWWGDFPEIGNANYEDTPGSSIFTVNSLAPNPWGLYNMNGNVAEWVEDCFYESYIGAPDDGSA